MELASITFVLEMWCNCGGHYDIWTTIDQIRNAIDKQEKRMDIASTSVEDVRRRIRGDVWNAFARVESEVEQLKCAEKRKDIQLGVAAKKNAKLAERLAKLESKIAELEVAAQN